MASRSKTILIATFVLVMSAGVVVGRLWTRLPAVSVGHDRSPSWLADQMNLSTEQRQQMDAIWSDTKQKIHATFDHQHELDHQRDAAVVALLTPQQKAAYDKIQADHTAGRAELDKQRDALVHDANDRSKALLSDEQKTRWDTLSKEMPVPWKHGLHGPATTQHTAQHATEHSGSGNSPDRL